MFRLLLQSGNGRTKTTASTGQPQRAYRRPLNFLPFFLLLLVLAAIWNIKAGYEEGALTVEDIEKSLTPEELISYREAQLDVDAKYARCVQYILYATSDGKYTCLSCPPGIPFVTLKRDEIWYIGHTCQDEGNRHSKAFRTRNNVRLFTNYIGTKEDCHKIELKLIQGYQYLPESLKPEIKLVLPPYNRTGKN